MLNFDGWTPANFISDSRCTSDAQIETGLEEFRQQSRCRLLVAFVCDPVQVDANLTFLACRDRERGELQIALRNCFDEAAGADQLWDAIDRMQNKPGPAALQDFWNELPAFHFLPDFFAMHLPAYVPETALNLLVRDISSRSARPDWATSPQLFCMLLIDANAPSWDQYSLQRLVEMVLTCVPLSVERQMRASKRLLPFAMAEQDFERSFEDQGATTNADPLRPVLRAASSVLACSEVDLFVYERSLLIERHGPHLLNLDANLHLESSNEDKPQVTVDWKKQDDVVSNAFRSAGPEIDGFRLAVPLLHRPLRASAYRPVGVLCFVRTGASAVPFNLSDLQLGQDLAQRIATLRVRNRVYRFLSAMAVPAQRAEDATDFPRIDERPKGDETSCYPWDLGEAEPAVRRVIEDLQQLTGALTVTVRLLSLNHQSLLPFIIQSGAKRNVSLDRFLLPVDMDAEKYLSAYVVRTGRAKTGSEQTFPGFSREELPRDSEACCLPLFLDGRVVGTLSATGSRDDDQLDELKGRLSIGALRVTSELAAARKRVMDRLLQPTTMMSYAIHGLRKGKGFTEALWQDEDFREFTKDEKHEWMLTNLAEIAEACSVAVGTLSAPQKRPSSAAVCLADVVSDLKNMAVNLEQPKTLVTVFSNSNPDLPTVMIEDGVVDCIGKAMEQILRNAPGSEINCVVGSCVHAGRQCIRFRIITKARANDAFIPFLYQTPFFTSTPDRLHLGAFLAAAFVRTVAGAVYVGSNRDGFQTILEVPPRRADSDLVSN